MRRKWRVCLADAPHTQNLTTPEFWNGLPQDTFFGKAAIFKSQKVRRQRRWKTNPPLPALWRGQPSHPWGQVLQIAEENPALQQSAKVRVQTLHPEPYTLYSEPRALNS